MFVLSKKYFHDEKAAFAHLEALLWADGVVCPHCGTVGQAGRLAGVKDKKGRTRLGLWKCYSKECRKQFTVRVWTVFESAHIPLHKCLQAVYLLSASKKGCSANQLHRVLEITYKSAWFLAHRIREAMRDGTLAPMGGAGQTVEIDETIQGRQEGAPKHLPPGQQFKRIVLTLVERGGRARSFHVDQTSVGALPADHSYQHPAREHGAYRSGELVSRPSPSLPSMKRSIIRLTNTFAAKSRPTLLKAISRSSNGDEGNLSALQRETFAPLPC